MEDTELIDGLVFTQRSANVNGPKRMEKAKIGLIQFCISPPKTDVRLLDSVYFFLQKIQFKDNHLKSISVIDNFKK